MQPAGLLGEQREHFGFTDGFSQPAIEGVAREDVRGQGIPYKRAPWWPLSRTQWRAVKPGEFVLGYEDEDRGPAPAPPAPFDRNASFMVWRKLHQDVAGFRAQLAEQAQRLGLDEELVAAKLVGRWRDGSPLVAAPRTAPTRRWATTSGAPTTSATATTSSACAARAAPTCGAPTRATRSAGRAGSPRATGSCAGACPTGPALPEGAPDDGEARGLLFVCLQASIARQFEIVQSQWCNDGNAFGLGREADPITGPPGGEVRHIIEGDPPQRGRAAAQLRRVPRRRVPRRAGDQRAAGAARALTPPVTERAPRAMNTRRRHGWNALEHRSTPSHALGSDPPWRANCHDESRTRPPPDADPPHQRGDGPPQGRG